jgi:hypothetical protein
MESDSYLVRDAVSRRMSILDPEVAERKVSPKQHDTCKQWALNELWLHQSSNVHLVRESRAVERVKHSHACLIKGTFIRSDHSYSY